LPTSVTRRASVSEVRAEREVLAALPRVRQHERHVAAARQEQVVGREQQSLARIPRAVALARVVRERLCVASVVEEVAATQITFPRRDRNVVHRDAQHREADRRAVPVLADRQHARDVVLIQQAAELLRVLEHHLAVRQVDHAGRIPERRRRVVGDGRERAAESDRAGADRNLHEFTRVLRGGGRGGECEQRGDCEEKRGSSSRHQLLCGHRHPAEVRAA
jgi:hypothetical protein